MKGNFTGSRWTGRALRGTLPGVRSHSCPSSRLSILIKEAALSCRQRSAPLALEAAGWSTVDLLRLVS